MVSGRGTARTRPPRGSRAARVCWLTSCYAVILGAQSGARAAQLRTRAPGQCVEALDLAAQVDTLLGRPLSSIEGVDFEVEIAPRAGGKWRLRVDRIDQTERRTRELVGVSCAEVAAAAAVAIAMSIRSSESQQTDRAAQDANLSRAPPPAASPLLPPAGASRVVPLPPVVSSARSTAPAGVRGSIALALVADVGALPAPAPGAALEGALDLGRLRLIGLAALFASQRARVGAAGGEFGLAFGAALTCFAPSFGRAKALFCAGGELGRLAGQGEGLDAPRFGTVLWVAPRADGGLAWPLADSPRLTLVGRIGAALPLSRPAFIADETVRVHRASRITGRAVLGVEVGF